MLNIKRSKKHMTLFLCLVAVLIIGVGGTIAFIVTNTGTVNNLFNPSKVSCEVLEDLDGDTKSNVRIENTGDVSAYIRAEVIITWQDVDGNVLGTLPVNGTDYTDYEIEYNTDNWIPANDGYYYYKKPVPAKDNNVTSVLIESCMPKAECEEAGYFLNVEIIASAIQADGGSKVGDDWKYAVEQAWGVEVKTDIEGNNYISK